MYPFLLSTHSAIRYAALVLLLALVINSLVAWLSKRAFGKNDRLLALFNLIVAHTQFLAGLFLYFASPFVSFREGFMKDAMTRYWTMEHILMMVIAIALITVGYSRAKRATDDEKKFKSLFLFNAIALVIILVAILQSGRGLL